MGIRGEVDRCTTSDLAEWTWSWRTVRPQPVLRESGDLNRADAMKFGARTVQVRVILVKFAVGKEGK